MDNNNINRNNRSYSSNSANRSNKSYNSNYNRPGNYSKSANFRNHNEYNRTSRNNTSNNTANNHFQNDKVYLDRDLEGNINSDNHSKSKKLEDFDPAMQEKILLEMKKNEKRRKFLVFLFSLIGIACISYVIFYYSTAHKSEKRWNDLADMVGSDSLKTTEKTTVTAKLSNNETKTLTILPKYETLYNSNKKLIGWLKIADTIIDYPVMQCDNNTYYLDHNFDQEEDKVGTLFLDYQCDVINGSDNYIIYGHHLQSGKMFSSLENYEKEDYFENHRYITFDTIYEEQTFEVMYVFRSKVYTDNDVVFKYYQFINANSEEEFNSYMKEMSLLSFYDTGVTANYGDRLLTLSTCDYNETNGRFVVVAKKVN